MSEVSFRKGGQRYAKRIQATNKPRAFRREGFCLIELRVHALAGLNRFQRFDPQRQTKNPRTFRCEGFVFGGAKRDRTADLNTASVALSQLSYSPKFAFKLRFP